MFTVQLPHALPRRLTYRGYERVALLVGDIDVHTYTVRSIVEVRNEHEDPADHFAVSERQARIVLGDLADEIIGVLHTHPAAEPAPSDDDYAGLPEGWIGGVVVRHRITTWYTSSGVIDVRLTHARNDALLYVS